MDEEIDAQLVRLGIHQGRKGMYFFSVEIGAFPSSISNVYRRVANLASLADAAEINQGSGSEVHYTLVEMVREDVTRLRGLKQRYLSSRGAGLMPPLRYTLCSQACTRI